MTPPLTAPESARRIGLCCWIEQQVFALLGGWVVDIADPETKLLMLELSDHAAWRAQRWYELLPTAPPGADALVAGADELDALLDAARLISGPDESAQRCLVAEGLLDLADMIVADLVERTTELAGASVLRIASILRSDLGVDLGRLRAVMARSSTAPTSSGPEPDTGPVGFHDRLEAVSTLQFLDRT